MREPPSLVGGEMFNVAVPSNPIETDEIDGARDGPKGLCQKAVLLVFVLHVERVRII